MRELRASSAQRRAWLWARGACVAVFLTGLGSVGCASQQPAPEAGEYSLPSSPSELRSVLATGEEIEEFLRTATVIKVERLGTGITMPSRITLVKGDLKLRAVWKTIDYFSRVESFADGTHEMNFSDSYKNEIAAYELAKLLNLSMVPPTVARGVRGDRGCAQLWVEGASTLSEVLETGSEDFEAGAWPAKLRIVRLFHQLIHDVDWRNNANTLIDQELNVYIVDSSRAFRLQEELIAEESVARFSRAFLERLRSLTPELLDARLRPWISKEQIKSVLARRDLILQRAQALVAEHGEAAVLYE